MTEALRYGAILVGIVLGVLLLWQTANTAYGQSIALPWLTVGGAGIALIVNSTQRIFRR